MGQWAIKHAAKARHQHQRGSQLMHNFIVKDARTRVCVILRWRNSFMSVVIAICDKRSRPSSKMTKYVESWGADKPFANIADSTLAKNIGLTVRWRWGSFASLGFFQNDFWNGSFPPLYPTLILEHSHDGIQLAGRQLLELLQCQVSYIVYDIHGCMRMRWYEMRMKFYVVMA